MRSPAPWLLMACAGLAQANPALQAGQQLFTGAKPLVAHMAGHVQPLPRDAARCVNCHAAPGIPAAQGQGGGLGPALNSRLLMQAMARRGGPPSRYDSAAFCRALREGIDPAGVRLGSAMPQYPMGDESCRMLWTLVTSDPP